MIDSKTPTYTKMARKGQFEALEGLIKG